MSYTKRTCYACGYRDIQPNMRQVDVKVKSGSSKKGLTAREVTFGILGSEESNKAINKWMFSPNKRNYYRNKKVWVCSDCAKSSSLEGIGFGWYLVIGMALIYFFL